MDALPAVASDSSVWTGALGSLAPLARVAPVQPPLTALVVMVLVLGSSAVMFWLLVWRATSEAWWLALLEWGRERGFYFNPLATLKPPPPLDALKALHPRMRVCMCDTRTGPARTMLVQLQTDLPRKNVPHPDPAGGGVAGPTLPDPAVAGSAAVAAATAAPAGPGASREAKWHVLLRHIEANWKPTGTRPAHAADSFLDLYSLSSFPLLGNPERFVIYGTDSAPARALSRSSARALLPGDVGLLLHGHYMILDFSGRPFDAIEFTRMLAVADQIVAHLPAPP